MAAHNELGLLGENLASDLLFSKGYKLLERNWCFGKSEIDIIARKGELLVIVEVKTRSTNYFGNPEESINSKKENLLKQATEAYMEANSVVSPVRFDIISIICENNKQPIIRHIKNGF